MSIASEITRINNNIASAYTECNNKGATMPVTQNSANLANTIATITGGSAPTEATEKDVNFYTYDGFRIYSYTKTEFLALQSLPASPTYDEMTSDGWNWTLSNAQTYVTTMGGLDIGDICHTTDGTLKFVLDLSDPSRLNPYLQLLLKGTVSINWGDGNTTSLTGTSITSSVSQQHTYTNTGLYTIVITRNNASTNIRFPRGTGDCCTLFSSTTKPNNTKYATNYYASTIKKVMVPAFINSFNEYAFPSCVNLESINIPSGVQNVQGSCFKFCHSLKCLTYPTSINTIYGYSCYMATNLKVLCAPKEATTINGQCLWGATLSTYWISDSASTLGSGAFESGYFTRDGLQTMTIPSGITAIPTYLFNYNYALSTVKFLGDITSIGNYAFTNCTSLKKLDFTNNTAVPTLDGSVFDSTGALPPDFEIVVPDSLYSSWIAASNWSVYSSFIKRESQV